MNNTLKKLLSVFLCAVLLFTTASTAFAEDTDKDMAPYCEIKIKEGFSTEVLPNQEIEIYADYDLGGYDKKYTYVWSHNGKGDNEYYVNKNSMRIVARRHGTFTVRFKLISQEPETFNEIIAEDTLEITVLDNRTDLEKIFAKIIEPFTPILGVLAIGGWFTSMYLYGAVYSIYSIPATVISKITEWLNQQ